MTLQMQIQTEPFGAFTAYDLAANGVYNILPSLGYTHPRRLQWSMHATQQSKPLEFGTYVRFWDDEGTDPDSVAYSETNPLFEGFIEEIQPADSLRVDYVAYDPTSKAGREVQCMSQPWQEGDIPNTRPAEGLGAVPRAVYNSTIDNDDDYQHSQGQGYTLGQIIADLLDYQYHPLYWQNAAPGDGTSAGNDTAYVAADIALLPFQPQEKLVFESETIRSAVERMLSQYAPNARMVWYPATRKWRIDDILQAAPVTLTLNQFDGTKDVLSLDLDRSLENRATAIKFYGPEAHVAAIASELDGSLAVADELDYVVLETLGSVEVRAYNRWQIVDPDKRKMAPLLPAWVTVNMGGYRWLQFRTESFQASWDGGATWIAVKGVYFDRLNGIAHTGGYMYIYSSEGQTTETGVQHYFPPTHVRLVYAYIGVPITVRSPETGFAGTAYTDANLSNELKLYDESLAVGYELGTPVTTATRLAQFKILADALLSERQNVIYMGGCTIDGIDYDFDHLNKQINIEGVDENGDAVTTGWESIGAMVTDVEWDYEQQLTTIQFSSDQMELAGIDIELAKQVLKIRALERRYWTRWWITTTKTREFTEFGTPVIGVNTQINVQQGSGFENPFAPGQIDQGISFN